MAKTRLGWGQPSEVLVYTIINRSKSHPNNEICYEFIFLDYFYILIRKQIWRLYTWETKSNLMKIIQYPSDILKLLHAQVALNLYSGKGTLLGINVIECIEKFKN